MRRLLIVALAVLACLAAAAPGAQAKVQRPIVYAVVIDGLDGDRVTPVRAPFISSLLAGQGGRSTYYPESRSVMIAETNPNHTAMMTGAYTNTSGIPGNAFALYAPLENEDSCRATGTFDETRLPTVTSGENANCPVAEMVFEAIKRQGNPDDLLTAAVFGKPKLGRIFAGRRFDPARRDVDHLWAPCSSGSDDDAYCGDVPTNPASGYAVDDATVMDEVLRTAREGVRGGRRPDFTFVNLHQVDSAGHAFGTDSGPYDAAITVADGQIERLVNTLQARGEWQRTVLILLSDHSMATTLQKTDLTTRIRAAGVSGREFLVVQNGSVDALYLANRRTPGRFALLKRMRAAALATPGVAEALYREPNPLDGGRAHTLDGAHRGWHAAGRRSGDLFVTHTPSGSFGDTPFDDNDALPGNHGGPQTRDNFFAVTGGGSYVRQQRVPGIAVPLFDDTLRNPNQAENVDPAPTIMGLFGLFPTRNNAGRFLSEAFDTAKLPGRAAPAARTTLGVKRVSRRRRNARSRSACRRVRRRAVRLRLSIRPRGGRYDLVVRGPRRSRRLLSRSARTSKGYRARPGRRYRFRVRTRAASGVPGRYYFRTVRPRRAKCSVKRRR